MLAQPDALARWTSEWERYQRDCGCGSGAVGALLGFTAALGYGLTRSQVASIADIPEAKANPKRAFSRADIFFSRADRVGFCVRAYSYPLCRPSPSWAYVDVW